MKNFWKSLPKPIFALAPMEDVTDTVFRQIIGQCAKADVYFTEFTNVEGILSEGVEHVARRLKFTEFERPLVAQIWGLNPESYFLVAGVLYELGFDGIDINMGCPARDVVKKGCCSALIENPSQAKEIIDATIQGAKGLPISIKTRCGLREWKTEEWISFLLSTDIAALTIHGRIASQMSNFPSNWQEIKKAVDLKNKLKPEVVLLGNGDVLDYADGLKKVEQFGVDGVMIGRGVFKNPWVFDKLNKVVNLNERLQMLLKHARLFKQTWGSEKNFMTLKKFFKAYIHGFEGAHDLRNQLMMSKSLADVEQIIQKHI